MSNQNTFQLPGALQQARAAAQTPAAGAQAPTPLPPPSPEAIAKELAAIEETRKAVQARKDNAAAASKAAADDPATKLAEAKMALARERLEADLAEHELAMDKLYRDECLKRGYDAVMRVRTRAGSIILRAQTDEEAEAMLASRDAQERATPDKDLGKRNGDLAMQRGLRATVLSPLDHFDMVVKRYHGIWGQLWGARNALIDGRMLEEGKGVAA